MLTLLLALQVLTIHGAPQGITTYPDPSAWVEIDGQCHWKFAKPDAGVDLVNTVTPFLGHLAHVGPVFPRYAELGPATGPITIPVHYMMFNTQGYIATVWAEYMGRNGRVSVPIDTMDSPGTWTADPSGLVMYNGHAVLNITDAASVVTPHGWTNVRFVARVVLFDGRVFDVAKWEAIYSILDPSQPEINDGEGNAGPQEFVNCQDLSDSDFGSSFTHFRNEELPIFAPITTDQPIDVLAYSYGMSARLSSVATGTYSLQCDLDLHHNNPGVTETFSGGAGGGIEFHDTIGPSKLAPGLHKCGFFWTKTDDGVIGMPPGEILVSLLTVPFTIGDVATPPPPMDVLSWQVIGTIGTLTVQQQLGSISGLHQNYQLCDGSVCSSQIQ